jgi:hypothetical protein
MENDFRIPTLPKFDFAYKVPEFNSDVLASIPDRSASGLLEGLDKLVGEWKKQLPEDAQPVILACLSSGAIIEARTFSEAGYHGVGIQGKLLSDGSDCLVLVHQSQLQLVCRVAKVEDPKKRYQIGFSYASDRSDSRG